jgi:hypothetical protein
MGFSTKQVFFALDLLAERGAVFYMEEVPPPRRRMWLCFGFVVEPAIMSGLKPHPAISSLRPADLPDLASAFP